MRIVTEPLEFSPHSCLATGRNDGEIIDFGRDVVGIDPHVYLKAGIVREAAVELLGMVPREEVEELRERLSALEEKAARQDELIEAVSTIEELTKEPA